MSSFKTFSNYLEEGSKGTCYAFAANARIITIWKQCVGPRISKQTFPEQLKEGILIVTVSDDSWKKQLDLMKKELIEKMSGFKHMKKLADIKFKVGSVAETSSVKKSRKRKASVPDDIREAASGIKDEPLREQVMKIAAEYIRRAEEKIIEKNT